MVYVLLKGVFHKAKHKVFIKGGIFGEKGTREHICDKHKNEICAIAKLDDFTLHNHILYLDYLKISEEFKKKYVDEIFKSKDVPEELTKVLSYEEWLKDMSINEKPQYELVFE